MVIATRESPPEEPADKVTVAAVTVSAPVFVCRVNASKSVAAAPGATAALEGSLPSPKVVTATNGLNAINTETPASGPRSVWDAPAVPVEPAVDCAP